MWAVCSQPIPGEISDSYCIVRILSLTVELRVRLENCVYDRRVACMTGELRVSQEGCVYDWRIVLLFIDQ